MAIVIENLTVNETIYKHIYSDKGFYIKRDDNKLFIDVLQTTSDTHTYTETSQVAAASLTSRLSSLENKHNTLQGQHDALQALPHITETYVNGTSWYRIYSDKWCCQGGQCNANKNVITFTKTYANTNYNVTYAVSDGSPTDNALTNASWNDLKVNGMTIYQGYNGNAQTCQIKWTVRGILA